MNPRKAHAKSVQLNTPSTVSARPRMLRLVEDVNNIHVDLLSKVRNFIFEKRREIEKLIADDSGQLSMFPGLVDGEIEIPEKEADEIIRAVNEHFSMHEIQLKREADKIRLIRSHEKENPWQAIGYSGS